MKKLTLLMVLGLFLASAICAFAAQDPTGVQRIKPKEIKMDRNNDGKIDHIEIYDDKGTIIKVGNDTAGDGKINEWIYYENGIPVKGEKDLTGSGKPNMTLYYDNKGQITKSEADTNNDGKIDEWVYYENGKPVKAEKDTKGNGKPDTWITY